jgi:hypothetical protein
MALITDIADAVVEELNGNEFSQDFTAERLYLPTLLLEEMGTDLYVTVVVRGLETTAAARGDVTEKKIKIDIAVRKKLTKIEEDDETDDLVDLTQEIVDYLRPIGMFSTARCYLIENNPVYVPEHMGTMRQFTSVITMSLKVIA